MPLSLSLSLYIYIYIYIYIDIDIYIDGFSGGSDSEEAPAMQETWVLGCSVCVYIYTHVHTMEYYTAIKRMK